MTLLTDLTTAPMADASSTSSREWRRKRDEKDQAATVVLLSVNDVYDMYPNEQGRGGIAELATLLEREKAKLPPDVTLLITLNGDFLSGSEVGERHKGAHMVELMNHLGIEYVVLGNHEFDFGASVLKQRIAESKFKWFGSNVRDAATEALFDRVIDTEIIELRDGLKLGVFGVCTQETPTLSFPGPDVLFQDVFTTSKRCVEQLQAQGADFIIALTHLSIAQDKLLARRVKGIDVMIGGHDHEPFTLYEGKTFIHKSGQNAFWLAKLEFHLSKSHSHPERPLSVCPQWSMIANQYTPPQPACQEIVTKYMRSMETEESARENARVLATLALPLTTKTSLLRSGEANMGNLVADALRSELATDFGLINGGFIRGDKSYAVKTNITVGILGQEMPFPRPAVVVRIQARDFRDAILQHLSKYPQQSGSHPHVSGVRLTFDRLSTPNTISEFKDELGQDIDLDAWVLVATSKFVSGGGDGCTSWLKGEVIRIADKIPVVVANHLMKKRLISYPEREGRITILE
uniref:5'-Nucleotidase C-terminal domain-containing protein n=1 Tax=Globisporangium ultimum (strain ATCC 200006 / CBS 805.95 / DAOM BR144) TaxID=431595 RepID=K3WTG5_GLOUD